MMGMEDRFNTQLSPEDEAKFLEWQKANPRLGSTFDYDARGFWKSGAATSENAHAPDTFKKPNHPTFSKESIYSGEQMPGGEWRTDADGNVSFTPGRTNLEHFSPMDLQRYFDETEKGVKLILPEGK